MVDGQGPGHFYFTQNALDSVKRIKANDFEWVGGPGGIIFHGLNLIDEKLRLYAGLPPHSSAPERREVGTIPPLTVRGLQARLRFTPRVSRRHNGRTRNLASFLVIVSE